MKKLLVYLRPYRLQAILAPCFKLLEAAFELLVPLIMADIIDIGISSGDTAYILKKCLVLVGLGLCGFASATCAQYFSAKAATGATGRLRHALFAHIQSLSYAELDRLGTATLVTRMTSDMNQVQTGLNLTLRLLLRSPIVVFGAMIMAFTIDVKSALIFAVAIPVLFAVVFAIMLSCIPLYRRVQTRLDGVTGAAQENLSGVRVIRAFTREQTETESFAEKTGNLFSAQQFVGKLSALLNPLTYVIINLAIVAILRVGGVRVNEGVITQGQLIALYNYMSQILVELIKFANLILNITKSVACAGRISQVLDTKSSMVSGADALPDSAEAPELEFRHVSFRYPQAGADALTDISFCAAPGETIGVIGGTGSGKSTLANLIPRFYDATAGCVLVRGEDVKSLRLQALRTRIGIVPQKALLFSGTIRENLRWGSADASDEALWDALRAAQADGVVRDKKGQLDAEVEPGGRNFSGGHRPRACAQARTSHSGRQRLRAGLCDGRSAAQGACPASVEAHGRADLAARVVHPARGQDRRARRRPHGWTRHACRAEKHLPGLSGDLPVAGEGEGERIVKHTSSWALRRVIKSLGRYLPLLLVSLLLAAASVAGTLYIPILVGDAIDQIVGPGQVNFAAVGNLAVKIAVLAGLTAVLQWVMTAIHNRVCFCVTRDVRRQAFSHLQRLPLAYLDSHPSGDTLSRMIADVDQFADGLLMGFTQLFTGVLTIVGTLGFMLSISWKITLVVVLLTPLSLLVAKFIAGHTYSMFQLQSKARGEQTALINEQLNGQRVVQAFSHEDESLRQFDAINDRLTAATMRATFFSSMTNPSTRIIYNIIYACVGFTGALSAVAGAITVGGLSCFLSYANQYAKPFNEITGVITELQNALACAARVFELIDEPVETPDAPDAKTLEAVSGSVELKNVAFSYTPEQHLIEHLNLTVKPGQRIAIVGPTGCGKTTLINLLMRFYDVKAGSICVDGSEIRSVTRESLRRQYGMVLQDTWLKTASVRENIRLAKPEATNAEVEAAARMAHADSFIRRLPEGYDTVLSDTGGALSAGQRQLLCIARVMLRLPPMLILDEATSSIDTRTEAHIQQAFDTMMQARTSFVVAHRLSTIREADVILVMKDGHIIEQGRHEDLLAQNGFYANLYHSQFEG